MPPLEPHLCETRMKVGRRLLLLTALIALFAACDQVKRTEAQPVVLLAAASTADAAKSVADHFTAQTGIPVAVSTGGTNTLARQLLAGAPGDVFLAANPHWADRVAEAGLVEQRIDLLGNRLVLIVPATNPAAVQSPADLTRPAVRWVALAHDAVPAGRYAAQALTHHGVMNPLMQSQRVVTSSHVRATLGHVASGEADAGVVYATDAATSDRVRVTHTFASVAHDPIRYPLLLIRRERESGGRAALQLYHHLLAARDTFARHGFDAIPPAATKTP